MKFLENFEEFGRQRLSTLCKFKRNFKQICTKFQKNILKKNEELYGNLWEWERIFMKHVLTTRLRVVFEYLFVRALINVHFL